MSCLPNCVASCIRTMCPVGVWPEVSAVVAYGREFERQLTGSVLAVVGPRCQIVVAVSGPVVASRMATLAVDAAVAPDTRLVG